jgi:hypothetical protein
LSSTKIFSMHITKLIKHSSHFSYSCNYHVPSGTFLLPPKHRNLRIWNNLSCFIVFPCKALKTALVWTSFFQCFCLTMPHLYNNW